MLERQRRERAVIDAAVEGSHRDVDEAVDRNASAEWVRAALAALPARCRGLREALYLQGERPYAEVADELGMPVGSIGPTRARCLERLRQALDGHLLDGRTELSRGR